MGKLSKLIAVCALLLMSGCSTKKENETPTKQNTTMTLHITVNNEGKEIFKDDVTVEGKVETLADFLEKADELKVEMEDGQYGKTILSILDVKTTDWKKGPWWLYESSNNESCQAAGQCDAASTLKIKDQDQFTFNFKKV